MCHRLAWTKKAERDMSFGYLMFSHNTDYPQHQITLPMGLTQYGKSHGRNFPEQTKF